MKYTEIQNGDKIFCQYANPTILHFAVTALLVNLKAAAKTQNQIKPQMNSIFLDALVVLGALVLDALVVLGALVLDALSTGCPTRSAWSEF